MIGDVIQMSSNTSNNFQINIKFEKNGDAFLTNSLKYYLFILPLKY